jgi:soluble lytic murein transglycosylase-like protein
MTYDAEVSAAVAQAQTLYGVTVDPALVHAVIEQETRHGALKITGTLEPNGHYSYGPMQVQDTTGAMHGISEPSSMAVPSIGIRVGTYELARLMKLYPGDTARAVAAYNAGAGNSARRASGQFVNQSYVDKVLAFWKQYQGTITTVGTAVGGGLGLLALVVVLFMAFRRKLTGR